ncbi:MAG: amidohydrolase family protein, partial [Kiritimatiellaeota bacterium]|nr:amidohydrolase family protein [Kiritimatiellota bacterium]
MGEYLAERGVVAAIAHTAATAPQIAEATRHGFSMVTHLYSAMTTVHRVDGYRIGGGVEGCLLSDSLAVELIGDGIHVPKELLQLVFKVKGADNICLVTDSTRGADFTGDNVGEFILGNKRTGSPAFIRDGVAWIPDGTAFAGSVATAENLLRTAVGIAGIPLPAAIAMMTSTPAHAMGLPRKGRLRPGFDADLVLLDDTLGVTQTFIAGKSVAGVT